MLFCPARWKLHYRAFKFENFLGEQAPRPPSPLKKCLVLIQSVTLIKSTGYFNNIVIEIPGEMIILFFPKIIMTDIQSTICHREDHCSSLYRFVPKMKVVKYKQSTCKILHSVSKNCLYFLVYFFTCLFRAWISCVIFMQYGG